MQMIVSASQKTVIALLEEFDPDSVGKSCRPDIGAQSANDKFCIEHVLAITFDQSDVLIFATYTGIPLSSTTYLPAIVLSDADF